MRARTPGDTGPVCPLYLFLDASESALAKTPSADYDQRVKALLDDIQDQPMASARLRITIAGYSDTVRYYLQCADVRETCDLPKWTFGGKASISKAFSELCVRLPADINDLSKRGIAALRPIILFEILELPDLGDYWERPYLELIRHATQSPHIFAFAGTAACFTVTRLIATAPSYAISNNDNELDRVIREHIHELANSVVNSVEPRSSINSTKAPAGLVSLSIDQI